MALLGCVDPVEIGRSVVSASHVWIVGLCIGMIFPRHKQLANLRGFVFSALTAVIGLGGSSFPAGQLLSRLAMLINGAIFIQSLWYRWTDPGARLYHTLLASYLLVYVAVLLIVSFRTPLCFKIWGTLQPSNAQRLLNGCSTVAGTFHRLWGSLVSSFTGTLNKPDGLMRQAQPGVAGAQGNERKWFVDESDLEFFIARVEGRAPVRAGAWEPLQRKQIPGELVYHSHRRMLTDIRKTEYLSTSITSDTSPQEVRSYVRTCDDS